MTKSSRTNNAAANYTAQAGLTLSHILHRSCTGNAVYVSWESQSWWIVTDPCSGRPRSMVSPIPKTEYHGQDQRLLHQLVP